MSLLGRCEVHRFRSRVGIWGRKCSIVGRDRTVTEGKSLFVGLWGFGVVVVCVVVVVRFPLVASCCLVIILLLFLVLLIVVTGFLLVIAKQTESQRC